MLGQQEEDGGLSWGIPEKYEGMTPTEKAAVLRGCIIRFLQSNGPATKKVISDNIGATNDDVVKRTLDYLTTTKQIYSESYGARDPTYYPNGRLAHPLLQGTVRRGRKEYAIRSYIDRLTGRNLTITEYTVGIKGDKDVKGGIRIDFADLDAFVDELLRIRSEIDSSSGVTDRGLIER